MTAPPPLVLDKEPEALRTPNLLADLLEVLEEEE